MRLLVIGPLARPEGPAGQIGDASRRMGRRIDMGNSYHVPISRSRSTNLPSMRPVGDYCTYFKVRGAQGRLIRGEDYEYARI